MENNGQVPIIAERDRYRKQLTFDIDTKTLEIYYPKARMPQRILILQKKINRTQKEDSRSNETS
jgi:hypothetical protein